MSVPGSQPNLLGRQSECDRLSSLVAAAKAGRSQVLVLRGEAGIGKTALLDQLLQFAVGCQVGRAVGVESEMELPFASLQQLCSPFLHRLDVLPPPQQEALGRAFGLRPGGAPDRFLVGLAALTLLSEVAEERPVVCVVDDAQWLDRASTQALEFVGRRLVAERVALVLAARDTEAAPSFAGFPELVLRGLGARDAEALLASAVTGTLDVRVRDRLLAESHGNPLALVELPRGLSTADLAFGTGTRTGAGHGPLVRRLEQGFLRQVQSLPQQSRRLLLVASADPIGDVPLLWRAAGQLAVGGDAAAAAEAAGLIGLRERVRFRHPLVRSAVYHSATQTERRAVHQALAEAIDAELDPDRRAWHRACAAVGLDESVAADLEVSAGRALEQGGLAATAAFLERAAELTPDPGRRARRSVDAASAKIVIGSYDEAIALLGVASVGPLGDADRARIDLLHAQISFAANHGNEALPLLLAAARRLEPLDRELARDTYLDAMSAALFAGRLAVGPGARQVAQAARTAPASHEPRKRDVLLDGLSLLFTAGYAPSVPLARSAVQSFCREELTTDEALGAAWLAASTAVSLWDDAGWDLLTRRHLAVARATGALGALPLALTSRAFVQLFTGDLAGAAALVEEIQAVADVTGGEVSLAPYAEVSLAAVRGDADEAGPLIREALEDFNARGEGVGVNMMQWARAMLCNGLGRYEDGLRAARVAAADPLELGPPKWALAEVVEAGVRCGNVDAARAALETLSAMAHASGTEWALGLEASRRAMLLEGDQADELFREALTRLGRTLVRVDLARAELLYGEWLRREGRRVEARTQLRRAHEAFDTMGLLAFSERARHELLATGENVRKRTVETSDQLTSQEARIAALAAQGLTNPEIGSSLYVSPRTVEWHLHKVFSKLGITTRRELRDYAREADRPTG